MKRSDALKLLTSLIETESNIANASEAAMDILDFVENTLHMMPSNNIITYNSEEELAVIQTVLKSFKWESEDETK